MAAAMQQFAAGDASLLTLGQESKRLGGKRRRTVHGPAQKPLFAAEAEFKVPGKLFARGKKGMLALYGTDLHVVDVLGLEADLGGNPDVTAHVLKWVNYVDLLDISFAGPTALKIEHGDTSDRPKVRGVGGDSFTAASEDDQGGASYGGASSVSASSAGPLGSASNANNASIRVTSESFTLTFRDAAVAHQAAAALLFQQAQYAAMCHWLRMGLHAGLKCDLVSISALPLLFDDQQNGSRDGANTTTGGSNISQGGGRMLSRSHSLVPPHVLYSTGSLRPFMAVAGGQAAAPWTAGGAGTSSAAAAAAAAAKPYPWGDAAASGSAPEWGCSVPLPLSWGSVLDAAASGSASGDTLAGDEPGAMPEALTCPVVLEHGPKALQVTVSTPLGAAVATITPQLAKAALQHSSCREILALPLHAAGSSASTSSAAPMAAFSWSVQGSVSVAAGPDGSIASNNTSGGAGYDTDDNLSSFGGASNACGGVPLMHTLDTFAALTVEIVRTPATANTRGCAPVDTAQLGAPAAGHGSSVSGAAGPASSAASSQQASVTMQLQLAVCAVLAGLAIQQFRAQPLLLVVQLLLLAALAFTAVRACSTSSTNSISCSSSSRSAHQARHGQQPAAAAATPGAAQGSSKDSSEDGMCCGWSIMLVSADLCSAPSRHLQLQVSLAKASRGMARLRLRMASMSAGGAALPLPLLAAASEEEEDIMSLPVLVSDPEPLWLNTDTKQRFINAKPTLEASQEQARRTHKWRQEMDVDTVLMRPCPKFPLMCRLLPTYLLSDDTPEGHAVVLMKIGGVKDLCDAIFHTPDGAPNGLSLLEAEHTLALLNEYLVQVAAPKPLPAGFQVILEGASREASPGEEGAGKLRACLVQIYDLAGFKLSYVNGDMMQLFKMLARFGLYYVERLQLALVINAPAWFSTPWKAMSVFLDENTSAKVVVVGNPKSALKTLSHHLGGLENVPAEWGGNCTLPFEEYPANMRMRDFGLALNAGEKPFPGLRKD